ncbi:Pycsar system effector family protein [Polaribacter marinivivus]|uniref:Pycsar system effector family protein n=1 Tax=Polaribacter marinivivus TaxID=1524260 RepID=UPI003D329648
MEKDRLKYCISRFDHYFESVNNKTSVYIAINTFITGSNIVLLTQTEITKNLPTCGQVCFWIMLAIGILNLILLSIVSIPYYSTKPKSIYYFGAISKLTKNEFNKTSKSYTEKEELKDLRSQVFILSEGLTKKYHKLEISGYLLVTQFVFLMPILIILISNN